MRTVELYTDKEFSDRWPVYTSETLILRKNFARVHGYLIVGPGWELDYTPEFQAKQRGIVERLKQKIADATGALAHMEAHPEPEAQLIRGGIPLNEIRDREDDHGNPPPPPPAPPDQDFRKGKSK